jgi:hypothetical protein
MTTVLLWALPFGGAVLLCVIYGRYNVAATLRDWDLTLGPGARHLVEVLEIEVTGTRVATGSMLRRAAAARLREDHAEATRLLLLLSAVIAEDTPRRVERLRRMSRLIRVASAVVPAARLRAGAYNLPAIRTLVASTAPLHHLLVTSAERFVLRAHVLVVGFWLALRSLRGSVAAAAATHTATALATRSAEAGRALDDWSHLDVEHLDAFRCFVASLEAERREHGVVVWTDM